MWYQQDISIILRPKSGGKSEPFLNIISILIHYTNRGLIFICGAWTTVSYFRSIPALSFFVLLPTPWSIPYFSCFKHHLLLKSAFLTLKIPWNQQFFLVKPPFFGHIHSVPAFLLTLDLPDGSLYMISDIPDHVTLALGNAHATIFYIRCVYINIYIYTYYRLYIYI